MQNIASCSLTRSNGAERRSVLRWFSNPYSPQTFRLAQSNELLRAQVAVGTGLGTETVHERPDRAIYRTENGLGPARAFCLVCVLRSARLSPDHSRHLELDHTHARSRLLWSAYAHHARRLPLQLPQSGRMTQHCAEYTSHIASTRALVSSASFAPLGSAPTTHATSSQITSGKVVSKRLARQEAEAKRSARHLTLYFQLLLYWFGFRFRFGFLIYPYLSFCEVSQCVHRPMRTHRTDIPSISYA